MSNREQIGFELRGEEIVFSTLIDRPELEALLICKSGSANIFNIASGMQSKLGQLFFESYLLDLQVHSFEDFVCISQRNGTLGVVLNSADPAFEKRLKRDDYCAHVSQFPIAFCSIGGKAHLIHGTDWNRLDITCLENDELLTDRVVDYDTDSNYFDYFHSSLSTSPDSRSFISNGWHWHPFGQITFYTIDRFLATYEFAHVDLDLVTDGLEEARYSLGWDRPVCWLDNTTLAIGYNRGVGYYPPKAFPSEIIIYDLIRNAIVRKVSFDGFRIGSDDEVIGRLHFKRDKGQFIGINNKSGLLVADTAGNVIAKRPELASYEFSERHSVCCRIDTKSQLIDLIEIDD